MMQLLSTPSKAHVFGHLIFDMLFYYYTYELYV